MKKIILGALLLLSIATYSKDDNKYNYNDDYNDYYEDDDKDDDKDYYGDYDDDNDDDDDDDDDDYCEDDETPPTAPINKYNLVLCLAGTLYAGKKIMSKQ